MEKTRKKFNFLGRIKISIFNLEKYGQFILENVKVSIKYILLLMVIVTLVFSIFNTKEVTDVFDRGIDYLENEFPEFTLKDGKIEFKEKVEGYDQDYKLKIISFEENEITEEIIKQCKDFDKCIILLNNKVAIKVNNAMQEVKYTEVANSFNKPINNKSDLLENLSVFKNKASLYLAFFIIIFISGYLANLMDVILNILTVAIFGYIIARFSRIKIRFSTAFTLATYSLTLSIIISLIYGLVLYFTGFVIQYFNILYLILGYIYITAAILIIKTDLINQILNMKRIETQKVVIKDGEEVKEDKEEKQPSEKENKKDDNDNKEEKEKEEKEPDGSEI